MVELVCYECTENFWTQAAMKAHIYATGHGINFNDDPDADEPLILVFTPVRLARRHWRRLIKAKQKGKLAALAAEEEAE